jgi:hypothetical protein
MWTILLWLASPSEAIELTIEGDCDETFTVAVSDATPGRRYALVSSEDLGLSVITEGGCAGATLGLERSSLALRRFKPSDSTGSDSLTVEGSDSFCGMYTQAMDMATCAVSSVKRLSKRGFVVADGRYGWSGQELYQVDLHEETVTSVGTMDVAVTAMAYHEDGTLYFYEANGWATSDFGSMNNETAEQSYIAETPGWPMTGLTFIGDVGYSYSRGDSNLGTLDVTDGSVDVIGDADYCSRGCIAANAEGTIYQMCSNDLYTLTPEFSTVDRVWLGFVTGLPGAWHQACTFHEGELYTNHGDELHIVDPISLTSESTGIELNEGVDAMAGRP